MNTVEALKNLYKKMAGKDWPYDPNPTDAEVIDKIAADGSAGGSSGPTILIHQSASAFEADPIAPGLSMTEFAMSTVLVDRVVEDTSRIVCVIPFIGALAVPVGADKTVYAKITIPSTKRGVEGTNLMINYDPDTGEIAIVIDAA